jgi:hypothetical protein
MPRKTRRIYFLVLLLGFVFLAAQLHCCLELNSRAMDSHACPICSTAGTAITTPFLVMEMMPSMHRLEVSGVMATVPAVVFRNVAPRAPPAC